MENPEVIKVDLDSIKFAFQPIYDIKTGDLFGHEALMRPDGCTPMELINSYERAGLLNRIEEVTFYNGTKAFMEAQLDGYLFLNSFPGACMSLEMAMATAELGGDQMADRLYVEVLEYTKYDSFAWSLKKKVIQETGSTPGIVIDDFGTGENIDRMCIDKYKPSIVKIDRKFITHIDSNEENQAIVADMITQLHDLGIKVLAEGVETVEEYTYLMRTDIDYMQGFYLGKPKIYA